LVPMENGMLQSCGVPMGDATWSDLVRDQIGRQIVRAYRTLSTNPPDPANDDNSQMDTGFERATKRLTFRVAVVASAVVLIIGAALTAVFMQVQQSTQRSSIYYTSLEQPVEFRGALRMIFSNL